MVAIRLLMLLASPLLLASAGQGYSTGADAIRVRNAPDSSGYHVHVLVNGTRVRMLVDTGSNVTILSQTDATRVGLRKGAAQEVDAYGGTAVMYATRIRSLRVAGAEVGPLDDAAIDDADNAESILGMDVLDRPGIAMHVEGGVLSLSAGTVPPGAG
jgi:clan AA aspartic protease (TIGR02281 family)